MLKDQDHPVLPLQDKHYQTEPQTWLQSNSPSNQDKTTIFQTSASGAEKSFNQKLSNIAYLQLQKKNFV